jgi:hypothetical protein
MNLSPSKNAVFELGTHKQRTTPAGISLTNPSSYTAKILHSKGILFICGMLYDLVSAATSGHVYQGSCIG